MRPCRVWRCVGVFPRSCWCTRGRGRRRETRGRVGGKTWPSLMETGGLKSQSNSVKLLAFSRNSCSDLSDPNPPRSWWRRWTFQKRHRLDWQQHERFISWSSLKRNLAGSYFFTPVYPGLFTETMIMMCSFLDIKLHVKMNVKLTRRFVSWWLLWTSSLHISRWDTDQVK